MPRVTTPTGDTFDETNLVALDYYRREAGYAVADDPAEGAEAAEPDGFDPAAHTVEEVNAYLETADEDEQARVLAAEEAGKARKGILGEE